jgi:TrmH family RNA methyltransferase
MLTSLQNPFVKQVRKLHRAKERKEQQLFLLEGTHLLTEACAVRYPLIAVCCTANWQAQHPQLWQQAVQQAQRVELVSEAVLAAMATTVNPDGVIATAPRRADSLLNSFVQFGVAIETLQDPGNLGTIIRTAAAAGVEALWTSEDSVDLDHPKVLRASAGQWFRLPMASCPDLSLQVRQFQQQGGQVIATLPTADRLYWEVDLTQPSLIVLGNEGAGLSAELAALADVEVRIPLAAGVESLNVAISAAIVLYELRRQKDQKLPPAQ